MLALLARIPAIVLPVLICSLFAAVQARAEGPVNEMCPVLTEERADPALTLHYGGQEIGFCCEECRHLFRENPERYLDQLSTAAASAVQAVAQGEPEAEIVLADYLEWVILVLALLVAVLAGRRGTPAWRRLAMASVGTGLLFVAGVSAWKAETFRQERDEVEQELKMARWKELIHNNTYHDFGDPPRPIRPPVRPRLEATFYRGNDERSDRLFNGGNYLTSYLDVAILDAEGRQVEHGRDLGGQNVALRFQIRRGPHTPDFFWSDEILGDIFLTAEADPFLGFRGPIPDRVGLTTVEPMQRWESIYRLGRVRSRGEQELETVVYVADEWREAGRMIGATFHYGIVVDLAFEEGRIAESSEVYLGALFRPRKSPLSKVPNEEWLSHEPLPPLPAPQGDDPETLGIDEYLDGTESDGTGSDGS